MNLYLKPESFLFFQAQGAAGAQNLGFYDENEDNDAKEQEGAYEEETASYGEWDARKKGKMR